MLLGKSKSQTQRFFKIICPLRYNSVLLKEAKYWLDVSVKLHFTPTVHRCSNPVMLTIKAYINPPEMYIETKESNLRLELI